MDQELALRKLKAAQDTLARQEKSIAATKEEIAYWQKVIEKK